MKKIILVSLLAIIVSISIYIFFKLKPSGDINSYSGYYTDDKGSPTGNEVKVSFFGVSTLLLDDGETQLLIDGFFSRPSLGKILFSKIESDTALIDNMVSEYKMDRVKGIFVTHSHYDHAFDVAYTTKRTHATLYGSLSTLNIGRGGGVPEDQLKLYHDYEPLSLGKFTVQVIPSKHSPDNALKDDGVTIPNPLPQPAKYKAYAEGGSFDFYIQHNGHTIYIKPSPNFIEGRLDTIKADVVFIGMATIAKKDPSWQQLFYQETIGKLKPSLVVPLHWDDFSHPLSDHLVMLPRFTTASKGDFDFIIEKTKVDQIDFRILQGTKSILLFK